MRRYLPAIALRDPLAGAAHPVSRDAITLFLDLAGFTSLSERLARHGTAGSEQLGSLIRRVIGGALDTISAHDGDSLAFGGDAITAAFTGRSAPTRAGRAAADVISLVRATAGTPTSAGPVRLTVRVGVSGGRVTSLVCAGRRRHVVVHLGPGLDRAVAAQARAGVDAIVVDGVDGLELSADEEGRPLSVPAWASRTLHPVTALRVARADGAPDEHRRVTSVFLSVPPVDDEDPRALSGFRRFVEHATDLIDDLGGDLVRCGGGDKGIVLFALFGVPVAHPDDAVRAVYAVERLRARADRRFAAGVASGLAFAGVFGGRNRAFPSALGDATNLAARLMSAAPTDGTLVDDATAAAVSGLALLGKGYEVVPKGRSAPAGVSPVLALTAAERRFDEGGASRLVGRAAELGVVEEVLDGLARGVGGALGLVGEAGAGKSRLLAEVARRAAVRGLRVLRADFEAFGLGPPLGPFAQLVGAILARRALDRPEAVGAAVADLLPGHEELVPLLGPLLGVGVPETRLTAPLGDEERAELTRGLVVDLLCAAPAPTLIVLEDVHWADELSLLLLEELSARLPEADLVVVMSSRFRPALARPRWLVLDDLPPDDLATVARETWARLGGGELPAAYVETLAERSTGSPLFAETVTELVRRSWRPGEPLPPVPLPDELLAFTTGRLDRLGDRPQDTALSYAVLGRPATVPEIAEVFGVSSEAVADDLNRLVDAGIARRVDAGGEALAWLRHGTVAEALLKRASYGRRAPMHERVCRHLVAAGAAAREVARQLEHCRLPELEGDVYGRARQEARDAWALAEARHWGVLALEREGAAGHGEAQLALAELELLLGEHEAASERLAALAEESTRQGRVERLRGRIALENGRPRDAVEHLTRAESLGEPSHSVAWPLTMALCDLGRFDEARAGALAQLGGAGRNDDRLRLDGLANLGAVLALQGDEAGAVAALEEARVLAESLGDVMRLAHVTGDLAGARFQQGELVAAAALLNEAAGLAHRLGARRVLNLALGNMAHVRLAAGDRDGARRTAMASARAALDIGDAGIALDFAQVPIIIAELEGIRGPAAISWRRHGDLERRLGRSSYAASSFLRLAVLLASEGASSEAAHALARADELTAGQFVDLAEHRQRALDACRGDYRPPPEAGTIPVDLPPIDLALPPVTPDDVDALLDGIERQLATSVTKPTDGPTLAWSSC